MPLHMVGLTVVCAESITATRSWKVDSWFSGIGGLGYRLLSCLASLAAFAFWTALSLPAGGGVAAGIDAAALTERAARGLVGITATTSAITADFLVLGGMAFPNSAGVPRWEKTRRSMGTRNVAPYECERTDSPVQAPISGSDSCRCRVCICMPKILRC